MYDLKQMAKLKKYGDLTPKAMKAFNDLNAAVFVDGALSVGTRRPGTRQVGVLSSSALLRRSLIDRVGPFPAGAVADWVRWWAHARALGVREYVVPEVLVRRRIHGRNNSLVNSTGGRAFLSVARDHLRECRAIERVGPEAEG